MAGEMTPRKALAAIRKLLKSGDNDSLKQGITLGLSLGMPEVMDTLSAGISLSPEGELKCASDSEVAKRLSRHQRPQAMLLLGRAMGLFDGAKTLQISHEYGPYEPCELWDLSPLEGLVELETLDLHRARLGSADLSVLGTLTGLRSLDISLPYYGSVPAPDLSSFVTTLTSLERLNLSGHDNLKEVSALSGLTSLVYLNIAGTMVTDLQPLSGLQALCELELPDEGTGIDLKPLEGLSGLVRGVSVTPDGRLDKGGAELTGVEAWRVICVGHEDLSRLRHLKLSGGYGASRAMVAPELGPLRKVPGLTSLKIDLVMDPSSPTLKEDYLSPISGLKDLALFSVGCVGSWQMVAMESLRALEKLDKLECVRLIGMVLPDLSVLGGLPNLSVLDLTDSRNADLSQLVGCQALTDLVLKGVKPLPDMAPLKDIPGIAGSVVVTPDGRIGFHDSTAGTGWRVSRGLATYMALWAGPDKRSEVRELDLHGLSGVLLEVLSGCVHLTKLELESVDHGGDLTPLAKLTELEHLSLSYGHAPESMAPLIPLSALSFLSTSGVQVSPKPKRTVLETREDVAVYQKTLARALKRKKDRTPEEDRWLGAVDTSVARSTLPKDSRKAIAKLRKLLKASDWDSIKQAVELASALGMPEILETLSQGISLDEDGRIVCATNSEVYKRVKASMRMPAAFLVACAGTLLEGATHLDLSVDFDQRDQRAGLKDLSPLSRHTSLRFLRLPCLPITDLSPLKTLVNLESLDLVGCERLTDISPLRSLNQLTHLDIALCTGLADLTPLAGLTGLVENVGVAGGCFRDTLALSGEDLDEEPELTGWDVLPALYAGHPDAHKVTSLDLSGASNLVDLNGLAGLSGLQRLKAHCDGLSDLSGLSSCPELRDLDLTSRTTYGHKTPLGNLSPVSELHKLETLRLRESAAGDLSPLATMTSLRTLSLVQWSTISDLTPLKGLVDLERLDLPGNFRSAYDLRQVAGLVGLSRPVTLVDGVATRGEEVLTGLALATVLVAHPEALTEATHLDLSNCDELQDLIPISVCERLTFLDLSGCSHISSFAPLEALTELQVLDVDSTTGLETLPPLPSLKTLLLPSMTRKDASLEFLRGMPAIESLKVSSEWVGTMPSSAPMAALTHLKHGHFARCSQLEELYGIIGLQELQELDLRGCSNLRSRPDTVHMTSEEEVTAYRKRLARSLLRQKERSEELEALVPVAEAVLG